MSWLSGYSYRVPITITGTADGAQTYYPVKLTIVQGSGTNSGSTIYLNSHALAWPSDIRFTKSDGSSLLDFWREESDATDGTWWVEVDDIPANPNTVVVYVYYGKTSDSDASNGTTTFLLFDHFTTFDETVWTHGSNPHPSIIDSTWIQFTSNGTSGQNTYANQIDTDFLTAGQTVSIEYLLSAVDINSDGVGGFTSGAYPLLYNSSDAVKAGLLYYKDSGNYDRYVFKNGTGTSQSGTNRGLDDGFDLRVAWYISSTTQWHRVTGDYTYSDEFSGTSGLGSEALYIRLGAPAWQYINDIRIDWLFVRKCTANEPTKSVGTQEFNATTLSQNSNAWFLLDLNLKARYDMDTLITTQLKDLSGYDNHGTGAGGITFSDVAGINGDATNFDGTNDSVSLGNNASITNIASNALTLIVWVKPTSLPSALNPIIDDSGSNTTPYGLYVTNDGKVSVRLKLSGTQYTKTFGAASSVPTDSWTQIAFTFDGTNWKCYINKVYQTPQTQAGTLDTTSNNITLGRFIE